MRAVLPSISAARGTELGTGGEVISFPCQGTMEETAPTSAMNGQLSVETGDAVVRGKPEFARGKRICKGSFIPAWLCHLQTFSTQRIKRHGGSWALKGLINT